MAIVVQDEPTALHEALSRHAPPEEVLDLLQASPGDSAVMHQGRMPLHLAVEFELPVEVVRAIVEAFPDAVALPTNALEYFDDGDDEDDSSHADGDEASTECLGSEFPLHLALQHSSAGVARMLWQRNPAILKEVGIGGQFPLCLALKHHPTEKDLILEMLSAHPTAASEKADHEMDIALIVALQAQDVDIDVVKALLQVHPSAMSEKSMDDARHPPLHQAIVAGVDLPILSLLLDQENNNINLRSDHPWLLPLQLAVETGASLPAVRLLLERSPEVASHKKKPLLHMALQPGTLTHGERLALQHPSMQPDLVELLLEKCPEAVEWADTYGLLPLHCAARRAAPPEVTLALLARFPAAARTAIPSTGHTALHLAAGQAGTALSVIQALLDENFEAAFQQAGEEAHLPLHEAATSGTAEVVECLLNLQPPPAFASSHDPLLEAGHSQLPVQQPTANGSLPLHLAATRQPAPGKVVELLLSCFPEAAAVSVPGDDGISVLHALLKNPGSSFEAVDCVLRAHPEAAQDERSWPNLREWLLCQRNCRQATISMVDACPHVLFALATEPKLKVPIAEIVRRRPEFLRWRKGQPIPLLSDAPTLPPPKGPQPVEAADQGAELPEVRPAHPEGHGYQPPTSLPLSRSDQHHRHQQDQQQSVASTQPEPGLTLMETADGNVRKEIDLRMAFLGRYQLESTEPAHSSATCIVLFAVDIDSQSTTENGDHSTKRVALKLMRSQRHFLQEVMTREQLVLSKSHVVPILRSYVEEGETLPDECLQLPGLTRVKALGRSLPSLRSAPDVTDVAEYRFSIVMDRADRTLDAAITNERFAGHNWVRVRDIANNVGEDLKHLHSRGIIHGDFKPLNIVRVGMDWKLIDMDVSCREGSGFGEKQPSSGYCPPEMARILRAVGADGGRPRLSACLGAPSYDMWSFGVVLFHMATGKTLWHTDQDDNIAGSDLDQLASWDEWRLHDCLTDAGMDAPGREPLRDLLEKLLAGDPHNRTEAFPKGMADVLRHEFFDGSTSVQIVHLDKKLSALGWQQQQGQQELLGRMDSMLQQLNAQTRMLHTLLDEEQDCPGLVCMVPGGSTSWWQRAIRPGGWLGEEVNVFFVDPITFTLAATNSGKGFRTVFAHKWVKKAAPYLKIGLTSLKVAAAAGRLAGIPVPDVMGLLESQLNSLQFLTDETADWLSETIPSSEEALDGLEQKISKAVNFSSSHEQQPADSKEREVIRRSMAELVAEFDRSPHSSYWRQRTGLVRAVCSLSGESAWVLPKHKADFEVKGRQLMGMSSQVQQGVVEGQHELLIEARGDMQRLRAENDALKEKLSRLKAIGEPDGRDLTGVALPGAVEQTSLTPGPADLRQISEALAKVVSNHVSSRLEGELETMRGILEKIHNSIVSEPNRRHEAANEVGATGDGAEGSQDTSSPSRHRQRSEASTSCCCYNM